MKQQNSKKQRIEQIIAFLTLTALIIAGILGFRRSMSDISNQVTQMVPHATHYQKTGFEQYALLTDSSQHAIAYVDVNKYNGFGGPLKVATAVDSLGNIVNILVVDHKETQSWFNRVMESQLIPQLKNKNYSDKFKLGKDIDAITGATYTSRAITECVKHTSRSIAVKQYHLKAPPITKKRIKFGLPEMILAILLLIGTFGINKASAKNKKRIRWLTLLTGLSVIGFGINHPLTLVDINKFLMGYFPDIHNQIYWYILVFGILLIFLTTKKNVYCTYICPFGSAQECLSLVAKARQPKRTQLTNTLKWGRRLFVLSAILLGLIYRNPGFSSYEVYGTLFTLSGTNMAVFFLVLVLIIALFIKRPWCNFLCPIPAIEDFSRYILKQFSHIISRNKS
ncbi:FMN-binding protein [Prolixibacteraceae bacterium JC049]|nr:FMN-binding protein [Prolixibacteraceae bacterium JC049]